jgi:hypothetical protein
MGRVPARGRCDAAAASGGSRPAVCESANSRVRLWQGVQIRPAIPAALIAALTASLALAGCTLPSEDADVTTTGTTTGTQGQGGGPTGDAAGTHTTQTATEDPQHDLAVQANGTIQRCGDEGDDAGDWCLHVMAKNVGRDAFAVSNICVPPWLDAMERNGETVQPREPMSYCAAFGTRPVVPGESVHGRFTWDERVWNDDTQSLGPAPAGEYDWTATLTYYWDDQVRHLNVTLPVTVA